MKKKKTEKGRFCFEVAVEKKMKKNENRESSVSLFLSPKRPKTNSLLLSTRGGGLEKREKDAFTNQLPFQNEPPLEPHFYFLMCFFSICLYNFLSFH